MAFLMLLGATLLSVAAPGFQEPSEPADAAFRAEAERYWRIVERRPRPGTALDLLYRHYFDANRLADLDAELAERARREPATAGWPIISGLVHARRSEWPQAHASLAEASRRAPLDPYPHYARGLLFDRQVQLDEAMTEFAEAVKLGASRDETLDALKRMGRIRMRQGRLSEALETLNELAERFPRDRQVLEELAELLAEEGESAEAMKRWRQLVELSDDPYQRLKAEIEIAELLVRQGSHAAAIEHFGRLLSSVAPDSWFAEDLHRRIENSFLGSADPRGLVRFYEERLQAYPDDLQSLVNLARSCAALGDDRQSVARFRLAVEKAPARRDLREAYIDALVRTGSHAEAVREGETLVEQLPADVQSLMSLGRLYLLAATDENRSEAEGRAIATWNRVAGIRPDDPTLAIQVAEACRAERQALRARTVARDRSNEPLLSAVLDDAPSALDAAAEEFYREAVRRAPHLAQYHEYLGNYLHQAGRGDEALEAWAAMVAGGEATAADWSRLADVYANFGYAEPAIRAAQSAVAQDPKNFSVRDRLVDLLIRNARFEPAERELEGLAALATEPAFRQRLVGRRVEFYEAADRQADVIVGLTKKLGAMPGTLEEYWTLARLLDGTWSHAEAARWMAEALALAGDDVFLLREYARLLHRAGMLEDSIAQYRRLVQLDENSRSTHYEQIVELELQRGNHREAEQVADMLVARSPSNLSGYRLRAAIAFRLDERERGLAVLRRAVDMAPRDFAIRRELAAALAGNSRPNEALEHLWRCFELASELAEKRSLIITMTDLALQTRRYDDFLAELRALGQRQENRNAVGLCLVDSLLRTRRLEQAQHELHRLLEDGHGDLEVLGQLARLAESGHQWLNAIGYQKRIVAAAPTPEHLETLARYYLENNDDRRVQDVWRRIVETAGDDSAVVATADRVMHDGKLAHARTIVELGVARFPGSWRLVYRRGFLCYATRSWDQAVESFDFLAAEYARDEATAAAPPGSRTSPVAPASAYGGTTTLIPAGEMDELSAAGQAFARYESPISVDAQGVVHLPGGQRTAVRAGNVRFNALAPHLRMPVTRAEAALESVVARFCLSQKTGDADAWLEALRRAAAGEQRALRQLLLVYSISDRFHGDEGRAVVRDALVRMQDDPMPRLAVLALPGLASQVDDFTRPSDVEELRGLIDECYTWIEQHRPAWVHYLEACYIDQLWQLGERDRAAGLLADRIAATSTLQDLGEIGITAYEWDHPPLVEQVLGKAADLARERPQDTAELDALGGILASAVSVPSQRLSPDAERAVMQLFRIQLAAGAPAASASGSLRSQLVQLQHRIQAISQSGATRSVLHDRLVRQQQWLLSQYQVYEKNSGKRTPFPHHGTILNDDLFSLLQTLVWRMNVSRDPTLLETQLREWAGEESGDAADRCRLALAAVLFWNKKWDDAVALLEPWSGAVPDRTDLKIALVEGLLRAGKPKQALATLDSIEHPDEQYATDARTLRADVSRRWSDSFKETVLAGHEHVVRAVAVSSDNALLASGSYDRTVILWDLQSGKERHRLAGHADTIVSVAFSPDSKTLASCGYDGSIRLWNTATGQLERALHQGPHVMRCVAFTPDGKQLVGGGDDKLVHVWNAETGERLHALAGHTEMIFGVDVARDGRTVASSAADHTIRIWDLETGMETSRLDGHSGTVMCVRFSPDGRLLASASDDDTIKLWKLADKQFFATLVGHTSTVTEVAFSPDGKLLASSGKDKTVRVWSVFRRRSPFTMLGHTNGVTAVTFTPDGEHVASAGYDRLVILWRLRIADVWGEDWDE